MWLVYQKEKKKEYHTVCEMLAIWIIFTKICDRHIFLVSFAMPLPCSLLAQQHIFCRYIFVLTPVIKCVLCPDLDCVGKHWKGTE